MSETCSGWFFWDYGEGDLSWVKCSADEGCGAFGCPSDSTLAKPISTRTATSVEPPPVKNDGPAVWDLVMDDMKARDHFGFQKYGTRLQANNSRDTLADAYQEALDLAVYLRSAIYERDGK